MPALRLQLAGSSPSGPAKDSGSCSKLINVHDQHEI
jgi:hypothetical protein